ncbi:MAG: hypothetical protein ACPG4K_01390 [Haloferula sp.]
MVTISLMVLLSLLAVGLLSLSSISLRSGSNVSAMAEARANARLALNIAIGELQKEMGPDMRISAESAMFDADESTEGIDGLAQSRWMASYDSWGDWLNASYRRPGDGGTLNIEDTYTPRRAEMFRRWLLSLPPGMESDINAPDAISGWNESNSVLMVGPGSLGPAANTHPDQVTRAYLLNVGESGRQAWWVSPENHKAKANLARQPRELSGYEWEVAQGNTAEVGVGALEGFEALDDNAQVSDKLISQASIELADVSKASVRERFFDLTSFSEGVLASVRTGHLKKDLSLLFELPKNSLPEPYRFRSTEDQEPSIRPMSPELAAKRPHIPMRHFQSWTNMRHYYRMYRDDADANTGGSGGTGGSDSAGLSWDGRFPYTQVAALASHNKLNVWNGSDNYWRFPIAAKITFIYSLMTKPHSSGRHELYLVYTPVITYWNPYNVELRIPDQTLGLFTGAPRVWPVSGELYTRNPATGNSQLHEINTGNGGINYTLGSPTGQNNVFGWLSSGNGSEIVFKPGQFRVFSLKNYTDQVSWGENPMVPGFDPLGIEGGDLIRMTNRTPGVPRDTYAQNEAPSFALRFGIGGWVFNMNNGNTPGSLCLLQSWGNRGSDPPMMYQHDWLRADIGTYPRTESEGFTAITLDPQTDGAGVATLPQNLEPWVFDGQPRPIAFIQLVLKGATPLDYESINWNRKDWRSRNWIQSPPNYYGGSLYISEDQSIADTQRWDDSYSMNFGPLSTPGDAVALADPFNDASIANLGSGVTPIEQVSEVAALELPTAPVSSLAGFNGMRINPGWTDPQAIVDHSSSPKLRLQRLSGVSTPTHEASAYCAEMKIYTYQSGVTGPGIGNSFMHPMLERTEVYRDFDNSKSMDPRDRDTPLDYQENDLKLFRDYWDHALLLNDALWDDYFVSSVADRERTSRPNGGDLSENLDRFVEGEDLPNNRYRFHRSLETTEQIREELEAADGYLKIAGHLMVDGMFNVNSTSVAAWHALFSGIRERRLVHRNRNGRMQEVEVPSDKRIALSRFNTEISDEEMEDPAFGADMPSGGRGWSGVRFLDDEQLLKLARECVKQVKRRGPFLNYSEFINRRLSDDDLGTMGALQSAIDYDDGNPDPGSINYMFKSDPAYMISERDLAGLQVGTPEAAVGSRFAGIPGYVIQSDLLKPLGNTLAVRDDTFRIRAYGESLDGDGQVAARVWCEAVVQRLPGYLDSSDEDHLSMRELDGNGRFSDSSELGELNARFGRKFQIKSFRWLNGSEI